MAKSRTLAHPETRPAEAPVRILIADDHDVVRMGVRLLLESQPGWVVCGEARTGREAVAKAFELRPDVIVLDVSMPELNGVEVTRQVRRSMPASILIVTEIAVTVVLLVSAGLVLRSFTRLLSVDPGFSTDAVLTIDLQIPADRYRDAAARKAFYDRAFEALSDSPQVAEVGAAVVTPLTGNNWTVPFERSDQPVPSGERPPDVGWQLASGGYFKALDAGTFPVERGFRYTNETDFRLTVLFQMLISMSIDRGLYTALTGLDVFEEFADTWDVLEELGWVSITPSRVQLIGDGVFYTPLIQSLLARDRVLELRRIGFDRSV